MHESSKVTQAGTSTESCSVAQLFLSLFLHFTASCIRRENKKEKQVAVLATAGNKEHVRTPCVGVLMGVGGIVLDTEVVRDGPFSCRVFEPQSTAAARAPHPAQGFPRFLASI